MFQFDIPKKKKNQISTQAEPKSVPPMLEIEKFMLSRKHDFKEQKYYKCQPP